MLNLQYVELLSLSGRSLQLCIVFCQDSAFHVEVNKYKLFHKTRFYYWNSKSSHLSYYLHYFTLPYPQSFHISYLTFCSYESIRYFFQSLCWKVHLDAVPQHYCCFSTVVDSATLKHIIKYDYWQLFSFAYFLPMTGSLNTWHFQNEQNWCEIRKKMQIIFQPSGESIKEDMALHDVEWKQMSGVRKIKKDIYSFLLLPLEVVSAFFVKQWIFINGILLILTLNLTLL